MMCVLIPPLSPAALPTQQILKNLLLNNHALRRAVEKPTMVHLQGESCNPPDKKQPLSGLFSCGGFGKKVRLIPDRLPEWETFLYAFLGHCWLHYTTEKAGDMEPSLGSLCIVVTKTSSNSSCHRPDSAQTFQTKALSHLKQKLKP